MKKWRISCFVLVFVFLSWPMMAHGEEAPTGNQANTFTTKFQNTDSSLTGVSSTKNVYFQVLDYWNVDHVNLNMDYKVSQLTRSDISSITLSINGIKFHSFRPVENSDEKQSLEVSVPKDLLKVGSNVIKIEGNVSTINSDDVCNIVETPADWLHIFKGSNVGVVYGKTEMKDSIQDFNQRFAGMDSIVHKEVALLVPEKATDEELETSMYALSGYTKSNEQDNQQIPVGTINDSDLSKKALVVIIAEYDHLPAEYKESISADSVKNDAVMKVIKKENQNALIITSSNKDALVKAGRFAANQELMSETQEGQKAITSKTNTDSPYTGINEEFQLTKTGDEITGPFHQEQTYFMSLPANRSLSENSQINLDFRYAKNLDFDRSLMTVSVGGVPIGSKKLSKDFADGDTASFNLPKDINVSGNFDITISFDLEVKDLTCTPRQGQTPWAYITPDSIMKVNTKERTDLLFSNYPFPFVRDARFNQVAVVLPKTMNAEYYQALTNIFNLLGKQVQDNTGKVAFYQDTVDQAKLKESNIITLGSATDNQLISSINKDLYFKYNKAGTGFISNEKLSIESKYGKKIGTGQLIDSPFLSGNGLLVLTGATPQSVYLASKELATQDKVKNHSGDAYTVDKDDKVNSYRFKKESDVGKRKSFVDKAKEQSDLLIYLGLFVLLFISIIIALTLVFRKNRVKKEDQNEK